MKTTVKLLAMPAAVPTSAQIASKTLNSALQASAFTATAKIALNAQMTSSAKNAKPITIYLTYSVPLVPIYLIITAHRIHVIAKKTRI